MKRSLCIFFIATLFCFACNKDIDKQSSRPDPVSAIMVTSVEFDYINLKANTLLSAYNQGGSLRWQRKDLGTNHMRPVYYKGIVYISVPVFKAVGNTYESFGNFYAIDILTGQDKWKITNTPDYIYHWVLHNDILYCSVTNLIGLNYIVAYNSVDGSLLWKEKIDDKHYPMYLVAEENMLYFLSHSENTVANINAFDLTTRSIKWKKATTMNIGLDPSRIVISGDQIYFRNGTGLLMAFNKHTGDIVWTKDGANNTVLRQPVVAGNLIISSNEENGVYAFNRQSGSLVWQWKSNGFWFIANEPYYDREHVYFSGMVNSGMFLSKMKITDGSPVWQKNVVGTYQSLVVAGDQIFVLRTNARNHPLPSRILIYDTNSGVLKDSISVEGEQFEQLGIVTASGNYRTPNNIFY